MPMIAVLIVEDEHGAVSIFEDAGFEVHEAGSADAAISILELHQEIRLVFTDINMPGTMDGLKLAHYVRGRWPPYRHLGSRQCFRRQSAYWRSFFVKTVFARRYN